MPINAFKDLNFKTVKNIGNLTTPTVKDGFCFYYWILLIVPSLIMMFTENIFKIYFMVPMIVTGILIPYGEPISVQERKVKRSASMLLLTIVFNFAYQCVFGSISIDRLIFEVIGILLCWYILKIEGPPEDPEDHLKDVEEVENVLGHIERMLNILVLILTAVSSEFQRLQPLVLFSLTALEYMLKKVTRNSKYDFYLKWSKVVFVMSTVLPYCLIKSAALEQVAFISSILITVFTISITKLYQISGIPNGSKSLAIRNPEMLWNLLNNHPNSVFLLDRFWPLLMPIPLVLGIWSLAYFKSEVQPQLLGILAVFASITIMVHIHWIVGRIINCKISQLIIISLIFTTLLFEECSMDRLWKILILFPLLGHVWYIDSIYVIISEKNEEAEKPLPVMKSFYAPANVKVYFDVVQRIWTATSPFLSALAISIITYKTMYTKMRLILLTLSALIGILVSTKLTDFWILIEIYIIIEQTNLLFLSQKSLPVSLSTSQYTAFVANISILIIAECQRLSSIPSIFASDKMNVNKIHDKSESEDSVETEEEAKTDSLNEAKEFNHEDFWVWRAIRSIEQVTNVSSILALMAVLLFYPQLLDEISYQTCVYSAWAGVFTFLFFRPNVTPRMRYLFMGALPVASGSFFIYNLYMANLIVPDEKTWNIYALHAAVFWLSCGALLTTRKEQFKNEEATKSTQASDSSSSKESLSTPEVALKSIEESPTMIASKLVQEAGSILERLFVLQWTRSCALLAFMAASFNPSIFGVVHILMGCGLAWKNNLSARFYIPTILWLLCATFLPAILYEFFTDYRKFVVILVGELKSMNGTICLTLWALILFLQPVFLKSLMKLTTEKEREDGLVSFQILPQEQSTLSQTNYESFENSLRYYFSNWFLEFHNEIMIAVLVVAMVSKKNVYGIIFAFLTLLHVLAPYFKSKKSLKTIARISFTVQLLCFVANYCFTIIDKNKVVDLSKWCNLTFLALPWNRDVFLYTYILGGAYVLLTVRWYMTSLYYQKLDEPTRRFDTHWCRLCNKVSFKSMHAYSRVKHNLHLYLGWFVHIFVFVTAISASRSPSIPSILLLIFSLVFFFYGEASILMPKLRNQIYVVLALIIGWTMLDSVVGILGTVYGSVKEGFLNSRTVQKFFLYFGMTNVLQYVAKAPADSNMIFATEGSRACLGITVFLILLQTRLCRSKAWPFVMARIYHSYATSTKKAKIFRRNLQAAILFQQKNLDKASKHVRKQIECAKGIDISDWKKLCYVPPKDLNDANQVNGPGEAPIYGTSTTEDEEEQIERVAPNDSVDVDANLRQRRNTSHLHIQSSGVYENEHLDQINATKSDIAELHLNYMENSEESLVPSIEAARKEMKELETNFYWYTWISFLQTIVKYILDNSQEYRRLLNRPSRKSSVRIIFHHQNKLYRLQFFMQLIFDFLNSNFDYVLNILVAEAQIVHSSGFSLLMVIGVLLVAQMQRPFTGKSLHNRLLILCAIWITFNFCKKIYLNEYDNPLEKFANDSFVLRAAATATIKQSKAFTTFQQLFGTHIKGEIQDFIYNPTLILGALAYKRNIMRYLGLWDYGEGIEMARIYYQTEEDLDEIEEINVTDHEDGADGALSDFEDSVNGDTPELFKMNNYDYPSRPESDIEDSVVSDESHKSFVNHWKDLLWPKIQMPWRDFYVPMFLSDFICLFLVMYYWGDFTLGTDINKSLKSSFFNDMFSQNMIPAPLVNVVLISTFILVIDRALYVSKNYLGKFILQVVTLLGYHFYVFIHLPKFHFNKDISGVFGIKFWYFFKWIYWISSALQLKYNYPPLRTETFLGTQYGIVSGNLHTMYRSFPFLEEIKTIIDWAMTPSALGVMPWMKFSDIFERLYAVQCARAFQRTYYGRHQFGVPLNQFSKILQGIMFITVSVLILWSPFLILSRPSMTSPNTIKGFKLEIGIENYGPPFLVLSQRELETLQTSTEKYEKFLRKTEGVNPFEVDPTYFTRVQLPEISESKWEVTDSARKRIIDFVKDPNSKVRLQFKWSITRQNPQAAPIIQGSTSKELNRMQREKFFKMLSLKKDSSISNFEAFELDNMLPSLIKAPIAEISTELTTFRGSIQIVRACPNNLSSTDQERFEKYRRRLSNQSLISFIRTNKFPESDCHFYLRVNNSTAKEYGPVNLHVYSSKLPKYNFSSFNLMGLYATGVFTIAQLLKMMHADMTTRIQYDDLPNPLPLLVMCQQILMMRELGDFESEEAIYWQLIEILRNPQVLIEITKK